MSKAKRKKTRKSRGWIGRIAYWGSVGTIWAVIGLTLLLGVAVHDLPSVDSLPPPGREQAVVIKDARGQSLASYGAIYGDWLTYEEIPEILILAVVAVEDRRFFQHYGVDPMGMARAVVANTRAGHIRQGGSTITQQLAKNLFLTPQQTYRRKLQEVVLALWLEARFKKTELLELYLNRVYFGAGAYGVDAAARSYFGHNAKRLGLAEAAMLAGILKAPSKLAPTINYEGAKDRAGQVLTAMVDAELLTQAAASRARATPAAISPDRLNGDVRYFTDWALRETRALVTERKQPLIVYTSLDVQAQLAAEQAVKDAVRRQGEALKAHQGALIAMAPDGAVKAMVGGISYGQSQFNRAVQAKRQTGSAFKTFAYLAALERGTRPTSIVNDAPITVEGWRPENFSRTYSGEVTVAEALQRSLNTPAVRIQEQVGRQTVAAMAKRLGVSTPLQNHRSLVLGTEEVTLAELTGAYAAIANGGTKVQPYTVLEVHSLSGELLYRYRPPAATSVLSADVVAAMTGMLSDVVAQGTGRKAQPDRLAAGKSGTSQDYRDAVFVGFTADLVASVWVGNDDNEPMRGVTGGGLPAEIWRDFMIDAHMGRPVRPLVHATASVAQP